MNRGHVCSCCGIDFIGPVRSSIHRDGFGVGPEVVLCERCGGSETPTCEEIWARIAERRSAGCTFELSE